MIGHVLGCFANDITGSKESNVHMMIQIRSIDRVKTEGTSLSSALQERTLPPQKKTKMYKIFTLPPKCCAIKLATSKLLSLILPPNKKLMQLQKKS